MLRCSLCEYDTPKDSGQTTDGLRSAFKRKKVWENHEFKRVKSRAWICLVYRIGFLLGVDGFIRVAIYAKVKEKDCLVSLLSALASMVIVVSYILQASQSLALLILNERTSVSIISDGLEADSNEPSRERSIKCVASRHISYPGA